MPIIISNPAGISINVEKLVVAMAKLITKGEVALFWHHCAQHFFRFLHQIKL